MPDRIAQGCRGRSFSLGLACAAAIAAGTGAAPVGAAPFEVIGDMPSVLANPPETRVDEGAALEGRMATGAWDASIASEAGDDRVVDPVRAMPDSLASFAEAGGDDACCPAESCRGGTTCDPPGLVQYLMQCHDGTNTCWSLRAEALILWRSSPRERPLFSYVSGSSVGGTALDASQLVSDPLAAPRFTLLREDTCGNGIEFGYIWAGNFYSERSLPFVDEGYATSPPGMYGNEWGPDSGTSLNEAGAKLLANMQTVEVNYRERFLRGMAQFLVGFRWLQWNESLQMNDSFTDSSGQDPVDQYDAYRTDCFNNLYGGQIGIDAVLLGHKPGFHIDGLVKAGAFYNDASQRSAFSYTRPDEPDFAASNSNGSPASAAFVGEVGMTAVIPVHCNLDLRVGYFGLWIEGLAQPANQLSTQTITQDDPISGSLDTTGGALLQGLSLGLEGRW